MSKARSWFLAHWKTSAVISAVFFVGLTKWGGGVLSEFFDRLAPPKWVVEKVLGKPSQTAATKPPMTTGSLPTPTRRLRCAEEQRDAQRAISEQLERVEACKQKNTTFLGLFGDVRDICRFEIAALAAVKSRAAILDVDCTKK